VFKSVGEECLRVFKSVGECLRMLEVFKNVGSV